MTCGACGHENPDGSRFCSGCGAELASPDESSRDARKTVTVLFCDLAGFTSTGETLDPEALRRLQSRYFDQARAALERHGGTVEKFIGDAVVAVFGVPRVHEDDALRTLRAACELRDAVERLGLKARIGVNTGEVVAGAGDASVTGDAVNVAARLEQVAAPGEILLGETTFELTHEAVEVEPVDALTLKGKADPVRAHRLLGVDPRRTLARFDSPLVGRGPELAELQRCLERAHAERRCELVTLVGSPGIGKSRLAHEFTSRLDEAKVLMGRCLPYGESITYWPLIEIFRSDAAEDELAGLLSAGMAEEIFWSVRKSLERRAREQPLVLVIEDIHWAEPTFLDLLEHLADWTRDAPLLCVCLARPELLGERPGWGGRGNSVVLRLAALARDEAEQLIDALTAGLDGDSRSRVLETASGNPLFVEQLIARIGEGGEVEVTPTIQALLGARVDGLADEERDVLERASVVGLEFDWAALAALAADRRLPAGGLLAALVRKELIAPNEALEDAFRFRHMLIRDAAYDRIPKERRARLHERFGEYAESAGGVPEPEELAGYHFDRAYRYRVELDPDDATGTKLAPRAASHLGTAGLRARERGDAPATVMLLERACELLPRASAVRLRLLPELGSALSQAGRFDDAERFLAAACDEARGAGDRGAEGRAKVERLFVRLSVESSDWVDEAAQAVEELVPLFEELQDDQALARVWRLAGTVSLMRSRSAEQAVAMERAVDYARRAGDRWEEASALFWIPEALAWGPTPAAEAIERCEALLDAYSGSATAEAAIGPALGMLYAMAGRADEARRSVRESRAVYRELGRDVTWGATAIGHAYAELYLGAAPAAEALLRDAIEALERIGDRGFRSTAVAALAMALNVQGRHDEAEEATLLSEELASADDTPSQVGWRTERARALAYRGELREAEAFAREAVALIEPTDSLDGQAECALALAEILHAAGRSAEAAELASEALDGWERKGIVRYAERARSLLAELEVPA